MPTIKNTSSKSSKIASKPIAKSASETSKTTKVISGTKSVPKKQRSYDIPRIDAEVARLYQAEDQEKVELTDVLSKTEITHIEAAQQQLLKDIERGAYAPEDFGRGLAYAKDLLNGLKILRTFSQGVTVFGSARLSENSKYYRAARELGQKLAQNGHTVITGGGPGIMEAANRGAYEYGGRSIGLNITLDHEQFPNPYLTDVLEFRYFFARKVMLSMASKAYVFMPGGFGTMDEMTEIVILMQEHKMPKMPVFLYGRSFWRPLEKFYRTRLLADNLIKADDLKIMRLTDDIDEIVAAANKMGHPRIDDNLYDHVS